jgi:hypothetical protein
VRIISRPLTGSLKIPVVTSLPCHATSLGNPTFTDNIFMTSQSFDYADGFIGIPAL